MAGSKFLTEVRHPLLDDLEGHWSPYMIASPPFSLGVDMLDKVPSLITEINSRADGDCFTYVAGTREAALAILPLPYGKAVEAACSGLSSVDAGQWLAGVSSLYQANYFMARSILHIFGWVPLSRDMKWTVDIFPDQPFSGRSKSKSDQLQIWKTDRWSHELVWSGLSRLLNTVKAERDFLDEIRPLRLMDWGKFQSRRNKYNYNDGYLCEVGEIPSVSIPGDCIVDIRDLANNIDLRRGGMDLAFYLAAFTKLRWLCETAASRAGLMDLLLPYVGDARRASLAA